MANNRRTYDGVYNALKQISDEEGVDFGLDGMSPKDFKKKYFTGPGNIENLYHRLSQISDEEGIDFGQGSRDEWLSSFGYKLNDGEDKGQYKYLTLTGKRVGGKPAVRTPKPTGFGQLDTTSNQFGRQGWSDNEEENIADENIVERTQRIIGGNATPREQRQIQQRMQQRQDEIDYEKETGKRLRQPVFNPDWEAPTVARDNNGNILRDDNGNPLVGLSTDESRASAHQQSMQEQEEWDALSQKEKNERMKQMRLQFEKDNYEEPTLFETIGKKLGSGFMKFGLGILEALQQLSSGMIVEDASSPTGYRKTDDYDTTLYDKDNHVRRGLESAQYAAERMSREAEPMEGKGFLDMLWDGEIGAFLQKGVGTAMESLPMTLSIYSWPTMILNGISMAGNNYREQALENPDVSPWKRFSMAVGSAAIEQVVEMYADPLFKYVGGRKIFGKAAKEQAEELSKEITQKATETIAQRIYKGLGHLAKDAAGEGAEEVITNFGNDALGEALDLLNGEKDFGLRAQWEELKKKNPDANLWDFAVEKAKENVESFIGGAMAGAYTSGTTQASVAGLQYAFGGKVSEEDIANNPDARIDPVTMEVAQSFDDGYSEENADLMKQYTEDAQAKASVLPEYGQEFAKMVMSSDSPVETMDYLMQNRDLYTDEQIEAAADYFSAQARAEGVMQGAIDKIDYQVERANAEVRANTHQATGDVVMAKVGDLNYYVVAGDIVTDPDTGMTSLVGTGGAVVVKDPITGETSVKSPQEVMVYSMQNADNLIQQNETVLREQLTKQADDDITYGSPANEVFDMEDTVALQDGQGGVIEGQIVGLPNAIDGVFVVQTNDGRALQMTADEMNRRIVGHNGVEVQRGTPAAGTVAEQQTLAAEPQGTVQGAGLNNAVGEQSLAQGRSEESNPQQSALSKIPVRMGADGKPLKGKNGRPILDWHKASVEDAAAALVETTGGDKVMARDTATDLVKNEQARLEKIRKQEPKGDDPIEIAESRVAIRKQEQEQQAVIKHWQDVNQLIQQQMREEQEQAVREREAAKSEEQRQREAEEARIRQEQQAAIQAERRRKQVEEEVANWNKPYGPLSRARKEMEKDADAVAILNDTEPRSLDEWVSSLLRPQSMMWEDETDPTTGRTVIGLQSELGLQKKDIERIGGLVAPSSKGGKPFGQVVHDIWEDLPEGMRNMYDDQDVRNALIGLFGEGNTMRMRHLAEEHRIEEAREMMKENERRDAEAELDAWAEFYHLTPEEREDFEDWLQLPPTEPEQEIINQIIAEHAERQSNGTSPSVGEQPVVGGVQAGVEGGESPVQGTVEAAGNGINEASAEQNAETGSGEPAVSDDEVAGGAQGVDREALRVLFDQIGEDVTLADRMSGFEVEQLTAMIDDWEAVNSEYGQIIEEQDKNLKSKNKAVRDAAKSAIDEAQAKANETYEPIEMYLEELNTKYGIEKEEPFEGAIPTPKIDMPRYMSIRQALVDGYARGDKDAIQAAAQQLQAYVDEGLDHEGTQTEIFDIAEEYDGNDPEMLADQYIVRTYWDRYLDDDADQEYIKTGLKPNMREVAPSEQLKPVDLRDAVRPESAELGVNEANARAKRVAKVQNDVDELSKKYRSLTPIVVMDSENPTDEQLEDILGRKATAEELAEGREWLRNFKEPAFYSPFSKKIYIFADKIGDRTEESFFHENMHRWLENMENADEIFDAFWNASTSPTSEENKRSMERQYADQPEAIREEYMVNVFGVNMTKGKVGQLLDRLSPEHRKAIEEFLNEIRYDTTAEATARGAVKEEHLAGTEGKGVHSTSGTAEAGERLEPYSSFDELVADTDITVKDNERKAQLKAVVERIMKAGSTNRRISPRGVEYRFVYWAAGLKKAERTLLKPWANNYWVEDYDDAKAKTATWVDEREQAIYFIKYTPMGVRASDIEWIIVGKETLAAKPQGTVQPATAAEPIGKTSSPEEIAQEEAKVDTNPTEGQKEAGNYQKGHINIDGYDITIENPKGSVRSGVDSKGNRWETTMHNTYGYIRGTEGVDGDHIDVYLSDNPASGSVFVVDQVNPESGAFDEHKVMYGFASEEEAREAYLSNYSEGWQGLGAITEVSRQDFAKWIKSSHRKTKPFAEYKSVKKEQPAADATGTVAKGKKEKPVREHKRLVSDEKMEELKRRLLEKMSNLNEGLDMERMLIGAAYAAGKIERGVTKFADFCADMIADFGDGIREYLKLFYNGARDLPEAKDLRPLMDDAATVEKFDVFNFDKKGKVPTAIEKAEQVTKEQKVKRQAKKIKAEQGDLFAGDLFGEVSATESQSTVKEPAEEPAGTVAKPKTPWWSDTNRPTSIDPSDYRTYMTDEAKEYFANHPVFDGWKRKDLAFVTASVWDGVVLPVDALKELPEIVEAEQVVKNATANGVLQISDKERDQHAHRLLDAEHGSAIFENGKIKKINGAEDFSGPVRQERKALVIIGYPAAGKSSVFANRLSNENGARIIDSDTVKPWLEGFDGGNGAGYVQVASSEVAERALDMAVGHGDNIIIPRIGGESVIMLSAALKLAGYDVQLYFNDVANVTSVNRATSRFAETGRYLSLDYLTSKDGVPSKNFSNFAKKNIGDYINELSERKVQELRGRLRRLLESETVDGKRLWQSSAADQGGYRSLDEYLSVLLGAGRTGVTSGSDNLIFSYAEWKSNDVAFGEKPKEIWNSKSGKPMPTNDNNNEGEQKIPGESSPVGGGTGQTNRPAERAGAERSPEQNRAERSGSGHSVDTVVELPEEGEETRDSSGGPGRRSGGNARVATTTLHKNKRNNVGERGKNYAPLSQKARFNANVEAIKMMRALMEDEVEAPTKDQMEVLRQYSGWGGLGTYFNDENSAENKLLRELLTEEEYNDAVMSINSAYYTPANVIDTLWDIAKAMGFKGGKTLEGSAGIGNIIGQMPQDMSRRSDIEAVEIDTVSGNILRLLYPDATVHIQGFQDTVIPNGSVDLAITNVPFVTGLHVIDKVDKDLSRRFTNIHDFCIAKNIRKLKEGGIGIFITSAGTMDKSNDLRAWITDEGGADVVGAFRLNNETFGGTKVTSDIIVVRKRTAGETAGTMAIDVSKASPMRVGTYEDKWGEEKQVSMVVNDYFKEHPEMMAGEMAFGYEKGETFRPGSYGLYPIEGKNQNKMMQDFVKQMEKVGKSVGENAAKMHGTTGTVVEPNQLTAEKEGRMLIDDKGRLCVSERGQAVPLQLNAQKVKGYSKEQCFKDYQEVQQAVDAALQQQLNDPDDAALEPKLKALNDAFDKFVKRYGNLHKNTSIAFLRNDIDFPSFLALENYSETKDIKGKVTVTTRKAPIFKQRVLGFKTEPEPKTIKDAVIASIFRSNGIDLDWIAERLNHVAAPPNGDNWTTDDVRKGILISRLGFEDPSTGQLVVRYKYLSGNVREKLAIAEQYNASGETAGRYATNVEELRKVVPMDIPAHLIDFSLGSSWIPIQLYKDYLKEMYDLPNVSLSHVEGSWILDEGYSFRNEKNRVAGVYSEKFRETIYGHQLVAAALNNRPVKVAKQVRDGYGSSATTHTEVDQAATQACAVRVDEIKEEFKQWAKKKMQDEPKLAATIEKIYNEKFNALVPMEIGDEFLPEHFEGSNVNISLYGHQKRGVMRGVTAPTMLAHEVGTGKSFTLITTAMEMRRLGTAKKPMIVVQNATVAQMTADAKLLYPNAKVLSLSEKDRSAEGRRSFYAKIKFNDWDLIIVPQSTFERIPDSPERELQFIQEKIDEKKHVIEAASRAGMNSRDLSRLERELKALEQDYGDKYLSSDPANDSAAPKRKKKDAKREAASLDKAETKAKEMLDRAVDDVQFFDDLGVDALLVDEAHEYKHLGFQTSIGRGIKGIDPSYSKKCAGLYNKTRCVFEKAGWKNVVFATGTPISNTAAEIWTFMKYLMPADVMRENDIYYFDDFVHNFGSISQMLEFATSGKFKENTRFAAYVNKPELIRIWSQVADTVLTKEVGAVNEKIPEEEGGKDQDVFLPQSPSLIRIMAAVRAELERFENMTGQEKKENSSIPLTMYGIAKRAAIDPRLVDAGAPDEPMSKTNAAVKEIVKDLQATKEYKGTVAVFCDNQNRLGKTADGKSTVEFNIYDDMREKLIKAGVPAEQIAIIKSGMSIVAKQKVFDAVNSGDIRVVLGSTQTLGTGVNMQERLHLLIHMDAPDRPMDYTQRNGRIKRQGNFHKQWGKSIRVIRFGVEDSLDVTAYQRLKTKSGFIDSIMDGKGALKNNQVDRTVEEEEEGLFDNPVAVLSGSQYALKKNQAERELRKYQGKKAQWEADQVYVTNQLRHNKNEVEADENLIRGNEQELEHVKKMFPDGTVKVATVEGVKVDLTKDDGAKKLNEAIKEKINDPVNAIVKRNRENPIYNDETLEYTIELDGHPVNFKVEVIREAEHENGRIKTVIHKFTSYSCPDLHIETSGSSRSVKDFLDEIMDQVVTGQDYQDRIDALKASIERINRESEQLQQRVGLEFQFGKELEEAQKHVEEYTELMKKEMEEKEAKYAAQQKEASKDGGFDLHKAEDSEEDEDLYSAEEDWDDTKTEAFKNYFGDWENDPENASKVVDADGRPLVVYHGTNLTRRNNNEPFYVFYPDSHFGTEGQARSRVSMYQSKAYMDFNMKFGQPLNMELTKIYPVYLNIRNPKRVSDVPMDEDEWDGTQKQWWDKQIRRAKEQGYDGLVYANEYEDSEHPADSWIAFYPEQVKSADENVGSYDPSVRDIRYRDYEVFSDGERIPINVTFGYSSFDVTGRSASYSVDLMPDTYTSERQLLEAVRRQYPAYYVHIEDGQLVMDSWKSVMKSAEVAVTQQHTKQSNAHESYIQRKTRNAINAVESMAKVMGLDVEVLTSTEGLTGKKARAKGWFNPKTHKIVLVLPNHTNQSDLINTLLHEGVAHYGLRYMFGPSFDVFLDNVYNNVSPDIKARIDAAIKRNGWSKHTATEEYLARLAERTDFEHATEQGWWQKIKEFFLGMLAKAGFSMELSDNDLRYILWRSYDNLLHPDSRRNIFDKAREVEMQRKLDIRRTRERGRLQATGRTDTNWIVAEADKVNEETESELFSIRTKEPPKKTGKGYKVFVLKDGQLYPPMVANPNGEGTPVGVWLDADAAPIAGTSKTGRPQVKAGGKGTQGGSGQLAYRPGWHLGTIPYALQFGRKDENGERTLFPNNFVWAEVEYADDVDYQEEARQEGMNANGKYQHSLAGLKRVPTDGSYRYRTNPDPKTDEWIITGAMRVNKILTKDEVDELVKKAGREPQKVQPLADGISEHSMQEAIKELNAEIKAMKEADEMGLMMRDDDAWTDDVAQETYEKEVAKKSLEWQEAWQDSMASLKAIQDAIANETGNVATGAEDAYHYENRMHGRAKNMAERYDAQYYRPMLKAFYDFCKKQGLTVQQGMDYLVGKSGLERNQYFTFRDAVKQKLAESIENQREKLEKDYAKGTIDEGTYKYEKSELEKQEREGVDDAIKQLHEDSEWTQAKEDYDKGDISYEQLLEKREQLMRREVGDYYDANNKDYSGLTETFAKPLYDDAQEIKKQAQHTIDREEKRELWRAYDEAMRSAYESAKVFATDAVNACEGGPDADATGVVARLWNKINAATEETLKESYESGLMDRTTYNKVRGMFDYYVPLRGWDEDKASDVYTYMGKENVFSPAVKKTWGRTSKAENPLAYIGNIAISTILSGERNQMKQHFLNYVMNNPTSLVSVSESWYENIGNEGDRPVWVLRSADTAGKSGDELADAVNDFNEEMRLKALDGKAIPVTGRLRLDVHATKGQKAEHVVEVQRAGHTYQLYINGNPKAAQALNGSAAKAVSRISDTWLGKHITNINRNMAAFFTSKNPAFVISNLSRDLNMAGASVAVNEGAEYNARFIANVAKVLSPRLATGDVSKMGLMGLVGRGRGVTGMMPKLMRKYQEGKLNERNETERLFKEFMNEGGETGFVNMLSIDSFKRKMQREIEQMNGSSLFGRSGVAPYGERVKEVSVLKVLRLLGDTFEFYNRCAEDATRFIVYMTSRQMGKTLEESIADAKDVTLNFNRKGTGAKGNAELRDLFIFVNPAIQALANMYRMLKGHPLKLGAVTAAFVTVGALMPIINQWLLNMFGDDDDKDAYWNLPPWVRKNNLVMWMPGTKNFVTIPLAQEFRVFYGIGEMASSLAMEHPVDKWGLEIFSSVADLVPINPTGNGGNLMVDFAPTMVQPLMQIGENVDFTGKPIWRENQGNKYAPMYTKAYVTTPRWMTKVSEGINDLTGGNEGKKGLVEKYSPIWGDYVNNPAVWNHLLQGYFGGMYNTVAKAFDVTVTAASGEMPKVYQTPVINRFLNRPVERDNAGVLGDDYYHLKEQRDALLYELKVWQKKAKDAPDGDPSGVVAQEHVDEILNSDDWKRAEVITHYERIIKELKAGEQAATEKEDKQDIKRSISLYKQQMMEELAAIDGGVEPLDAAMEQYRNAKSLSEKKKLKLRIERLAKGGGKPKVSDSKKTVEKALAYQQTESADTGADRYLELATAENIKDDARIKAAKALIKPYTEHYKELTDDNKTVEAAKYRKDKAKWFAASQSIGSHERAIAENRKLLGKGNDKAIMKIIDIHRRAMLKAIEQLE